jgi:hypothetical protein
MVVRRLRGPMRRGLGAKFEEAGRGRRALFPVPAAMRIRTGSASSTSELAGYLRRCECNVEARDEWTLEVTVRPGSLSAEHARIELDAYLSVWEAMNPTSSVERLDPLARPPRSGSEGASVTPD